MMASTITSIEFLQALYSKCHSGYIVLVGHTRNYVHGKFLVTELAHAAAHIERYPLDLFIKVNVMDHAKTLARNKHGIGGIDEVEAIVSFHLDVDVGEKNSDKYIGRQQVLEILSQMPLLPSIIVLSNGEDGGLHVYWLFAEPLYITSEAERKRVEAVAKRWRDELERKIKAVNPACGLDHGANIDRLLRPVGATRTSGNRVSVFQWNTERRYTLEQFELPPLPGQAQDNSLSQVVIAKTEGEEVIERYLDAVGMNTVEAILFAQGYERWKGSDRFLIRPGSASGSPTGEIFTLTDGRRGFTVKSGAADPLTSINRKGGNGNWYSVPALWVSFKYNVDAKSDKSVWKTAAKECHDFLRPPDLPGITEINGMNQQTSATAPVPSSQMKNAEDRKAYFTKLGYAPPISLKEFMSNDYDVQFLVENCVVKGSSLIIAGSSKAMKTTISVQLALALASGTPLFNKFHTKQSRVLFASAESGEAVLKRNMRGMAKFLGVSLQDLQDSGALHLQFWVPRIQNDDMLAYFADGIDACQPDVVVLDPLYLALNGETQANLSLTGEQILKLTRLCLDRGITPIVDDHVKRSSQNARDHQPLVLDDITGAGKAEFFRQWFLVSRRSKFEDMHDSLTKEHDLWLTVGGSAGHGSTWGLDINETFDQTYKCVEYDFTIRRGHEIRTQAKEEAKEASEVKAQKKEESLQARLRRKGDELLNLVFKGDPAMALTQNDIRDHLRTKTVETRQIIAMLVDANKLEFIPGCVIKNRRGWDGYKLPGMLNLSVGAPGTTGDSTQCAPSDPQ